MGNNREKNIGMGWAMKILYVTDTYEVGGSFLSFLGLIESISENHKDIVPVILSSKYGKNNEFADSHGIENYHVGHRAFIMNNGSTIPRKMVRFFTKPILKIRYELSNKAALRRAEQLIDFSTIDLIHSNSDRNDLGAIIAEKYGIPHVWHLREYGEDCFSLKKDYIRFMNNHTWRFIAISHAVSDIWIKKGLLPNKISVVYNGVNCPLGCQKKRKDNIMRGVITGFVSPCKGQYDLIQALAIIKEELRNRFQLDIYGNVAKEYLFILKIYILTHGLSEIVHYKGYVNSVEKLYSGYDLGFMCSKAEGFGRVTVEYMMNSLCVIASDTGANQEIIKDKENGYIYTYNDKYDLAKKILYVIEHPTEALKCAKKGFVDASSHYTKGINADNICCVYEEILKEKKDSI